MKAAEFGCQVQVARGPPCAASVHYNPVAAFAAATAQKMSSRFTAGFETLHARGAKDEKRRKSVMFGAAGSSTLSRGTQRLVEKLARQSKLNRDQMRALGSLASAGRSSLSSAPGRIQYAPSMATQTPAHTLPYRDRSHQVHTMRHGRHRPTIKLKDSIDKEARANPIDNTGGLRVASMRAANMAAQREAAKFALQHSYLGTSAVASLKARAARVSNPHGMTVSTTTATAPRGRAHGSDGRYPGGAGSPRTLSPRVATAARAARGGRRRGKGGKGGSGGGVSLDAVQSRQKQEASALFDDVAREIDERRQHIQKMRAMGVADVQKEAELLSQINARKQELEALDKMLSS